MRDGSELVGQLGQAVRARIRAAYSRVMARLRPVPGEVAEPGPGSMAEPRYGPVWGDEIRRRHRAAREAVERRLREAAERDRRRRERLAAGDLVRYHLRCDAPAFAAGALLYVLLCAAAIYSQILGVSGATDLKYIPVPIVTHVNDSWRAISPYGLTCPTRGGLPRYASDSLCGSCDIYSATGGSRTTQMLVTACRRIEVCVTCTVYWSASTAEEVVRPVPDRPPSSEECELPTYGPREAGCAVFWKQTTCYDEVERTTLELWRDPFTDSWIGPGGERKSGSGWVTFSSGWVARLPDISPATFSAPCCLVDLRGTLGVTFGSALPIDLSQGCVYEGWIAGPNSPTFKFSVNNSECSGKWAIGGLATHIAVPLEYHPTPPNATYRGSSFPRRIKNCTRIHYRMPTCPGNVTAQAIRGLTFGATMGLAVEGLRAEIVSLICELALDIAQVSNTITPTLLSLMWGGLDGFQPLVRLCPGGRLEYSWGNVTAAWAPRLVNGTIQAAAREIELSYANYNFCKGGLQCSENATGCQTGNSVDFGCPGNPYKHVFVSQKWREVNVTMAKDAFCNGSLYAPFGIKCHSDGSCDSPLLRASAARGQQDRSLHLKLSYINGTQVTMVESPVRRSFRRTREYIGPNLNQALNFLTGGLWGVWSAITRHFFDVLIVLACSFVALVLIKLLIWRITAPARAAVINRLAARREDLRDNFRGFVAKKAN